MPKTLSNQKKKPNNMPITEADKTKFREYLETKRLAQVKSNLENVQTNYPLDLQDIFGFCLNDIFDKISKVKHFQEGTEEQQLAFKINLSQEFLQNVTQNLLVDVINLDVAMITNFELITSLFREFKYDEFFEKLAYLVSQNNQFSENFIEYVIANYLSFCNKLYIEADERVLKMSKKL